MTTSSMLRTSINIDDFCTGLIASLAFLGYRSVDVRDLDKDVEFVLRSWIPEAEAAGIKIRFHVGLHKIYGDSGELRAGIRSAVYVRDLGSFTDRSLAFKVPQDFASRYLDNLAGDNELWVSFARQLVEQHPNTFTQVAV